MVKPVEGLDAGTFASSFLSAGLDSVEAGYWSWAGFGLNKDELKLGFEKSNFYTGSDEAGFYAADASNLSPYFFSSPFFGANNEGPDKAPWANNPPGGAVAEELKSVFFSPIVAADPNSAEVCFDESFS